jgi:hypothetical protein
MTRAGCSGAVRTDGRGTRWHPRQGRQPETHENPGHRAAGGRHAAVRRRPAGGLALAGRLRRGGDDRRAGRLVCGGGAVPPPLGLPIPHTAILPRNKARLADNLARFIRDRFLDTASLVARLRAADPASRIGVWLQQPDNARALSDRLGVILVQSLDFMDDRRVRRLLVHALRKRAAGLDLAGAVGRILDALTENRRHQGLLDEGIRKLAAWLDEPGVQAAFAGMIVDVASKEYPKVVAMLGLVGMNPAELGDKVSVGIVPG